MTPTAPPTPLSDREHEVLDLLLQGLSNKQIAAALHITQHTVEFHLKNIYAKLEVRSRTELMAKLRDSVVADQTNRIENGDASNSANWKTSLRAAVSQFGREYKMNDVFNPANQSVENPQTFFDAIRACLVKYADFNGRAGRPELWWFLLFVTLVTSALAYLSEAVASVFLIAVLLPLLAAGARRLRDAGYSVWWLWMLLAPVGGLVVMGWLWALPSNNNESPKL